ncbi:response regulator transcription factor [Paenibacillus silvisoli]|uniref:response regulator transcription factor n=1 Tax=Paenibacillus silvisoli TaxID=3110539 RepID=UPI002805EDA5|nr:response regulator [Paenibacillus silvisoli]
MYKAIIIDDELPARRAIRALGEWEKYGVEVVAEAENGKQGLSLLEEHKPDVVFVDMKMPLMGGEQFLEKARSAYPDACYIVISGFDDFAYARSAMKAGSIDYLLKPIRKADLNGVIEQAIAIIDKRREQHSHESRTQIYRNLSAPLVKEKIYSTIIDRSGRFHHIRELEAVLGPETADSRYRAVVFKLLNVTEAIEGKFAGDAHAFYFALTNAVDELLGAFGQTFSFKNSRDDQELVAIVKTTGRNAEPGFGMGWLSDKLTALFTVKLVAAEGAAETFERLGDSYDAAQRTLMALNMIDLRPVPGQKEAAEADRPSLLERMNLIAQAMESGSEQQAVQELRKWLEEIEAAGVVTMSGMLAMEAELRLLAESLLAAFKVDEQEAAAELERFDRLLRGKIYEFLVFKHAVISFMISLFAVLGRAGGGASTPEKIKAYIDLHYFEELPVSFFAERFHMSKEHLTRVFKQKYALGIHEYQLQIRMTKAKEWLSDKALKIQTVSEMVGFRDQNYFSKAFKKYTGLTPLEFRAKLDS